MAGTPSAFAARRRWNGRGALQGRHRLSRGGRRWRWHGRPARGGRFVGGPAGFLAGGQLFARVDANLGGRFGSDARCAGGELQPLDKGLDFSLTGAQRPRLTHGPAGIVVEARDVAHPGRRGDHHRALITRHLVFATVGASGLILDRAQRLAIAQADRIEVVGQFGALPAGQAQIFGRLPGSLNQSVGLSARADHHLLSIDARPGPRHPCRAVSKSSPWPVHGTVGSGHPSRSAARFTHG